MSAEDGSGWLVEWDGGWKTAATPEAAEKIIEAKIAEWGEADPAEFAIVPNEPPAEDIAERPA